MSDHYTTQSNHKKRSMERLHTIEYYVVAGRFSFMRYLGALKTRLYDTNSYKRLTRYNLEYLRGARDEWQSAMEREHHEWRIYHPELGHRHSGRDRELLVDRWAEMIPEMGASFWKGTNKVWSAGDNTLEVMMLYPDEHEYELEFYDDSTPVL